MAPNIGSFEELHYLAESFQPGSREGTKEAEEEGFLYTFFTWFDPVDDYAYFGKIQKKPKLQLTLAEVSAALEPIPDEDIYPLAREVEPPLTIAPDSLDLGPQTNVYVKRPPTHEYDWYKEEDCVSLIPATLLEEAAALQRVAEYGEQHPNLVKFHGCRVRRDRITGLVLDRYASNLDEHLRRGGSVDKAKILDGLGSAVRHLHEVLGLAHNDINPHNVMLDDDGEPVLVDFGSCHRIGDRLTASRGTPGWTEEGDDYTLSKASHDLAALEKIEKWLDAPTFK